MASVDIKMDPVDFVTVGTIGPKGKRVFHLQAGQKTRVVSLIIEKEQAWALSQAIKEMLEDLDERFGGPTEADLGTMDMELREPIEPLFRVAQMGLGYDEDRNIVILVAQELVPSTAEDDFLESVRPGVVRLGCSREQMQALSLKAMETVKAGRADPRQNGRLIYYWT